MSASPIDYEALAAKHGAKETPDYEALAAKHGARDTTADDQGNFVTNTLRKTADKMNVENVLKAFSDADSAAGRGDWQGAWESIKHLNPLNVGKQVWQDVVHGNASDVASDGLSLGLSVLGGGEGAAGKAGAASEAVGDAAEAAGSTAGTVITGAAKGLAEGNLNVKTSPAAQALVAGVGYLNHTAGLATEAGIQGIHMVRGAAKALKEKAAAQAAQDAADASNAAIAAQREAGRTPLHETVPQSPASTPAPAETVPPIDIAAAQQALRDKAAARYQPTPAPAPKSNVASLLVKPPATVGKGARTADSIPPTPELPNIVPVEQRTAYPPAEQGPAPETVDRPPSPQETTARQNIVMRLAPKLLKLGVKPEDLYTADGRAQLSKLIKESDSSISNNKRLGNNYQPSDTTIDALHAAMSQWDELASKLGMKNLGDLMKGDK